MDLTGKLDSTCVLQVVVMSLVNKFQFGASTGPSEHNSQEGNGVANVLNVSWKPNQSLNPTKQ